jgi:hypothetical protein
MIADALEKYGGIGLEPGPAKSLETQHTIRGIQEHVLGRGVKRLTYL